eukprot:GILI01001439.1.p1 GENE.GILI01001439.1~~GILI01001439.1.p1  ORF type:complete len:179 (+),score=47.39 GILI01001439.1:82-618(+)
MPQWTDSALEAVCCVSNKKRWADGEDDGDAQYEQINPKSTDTLLFGAADKKICVPQKIDPKTFFANERTFLKWLSISVLIGAMALTLLNFSDSDSDGAQLAGLVLLPVSISYMLYSLMVFRNRANKIYLREPMRYDDTRGPTILVIILAVAVLLATTFSLQKHYGRSVAAKLNAEGGY